MPKHKAQAILAKKTTGLTVNKPSTEKPDNEPSNKKPITPKSSNTKHLNKELSLSEYKDKPSLLLLMNKFTNKVKYYFGILMNKLILVSKSTKIKTMTTTTK
jgi:hypothetical protein